MKNVRRSGIIAALSAVLLIAAVLIVSCGDGFNMSKWVKAKDAKAVGKTTIKFSIGPDGRTIMPIQYTAASFEAFDLDWEEDDGLGTGDTGTIHIAKADITGTTVSVAVDLADGDYFFTLKGYFEYEEGVGGASGSGVVAAEDTVTHGTGTTPTTIDGSVLTNTITPAFILTTVGIGTGKGKFEYNVNLPTHTSAEMEIIPALGTTGSTTAIDLDTDNDKTIELDSGYYWVVITVSNTNCQDRVESELLHVYDGMTSIYEPAILALNRNVYKITYYYNDGEDSTLGDFESYYDEPDYTHPHYQIIPALDVSPSGPSPDGALAHRAPGSTKTWDGKWYKTDDYATAAKNPWNLATDKIISDLELYAGWKDTFPLGLSFTWNAVDDTVPATGTLTYSQAGLSVKGGSVNTITITVSNANIFTAGTFEWYFGNPASGGTELTSIDSGDGVLLLSMETYYTSGTFSNLFIPGTQRIFVKAILDLDGTPHSTNFDLVITP